MYRIEIWTANLMRSQPQFAETLKRAKKIKRVLRDVGYVVTIFKKGKAGLSIVG